jgi:hypothetical protein
MTLFVVVKLSASCCGTVASSFCGVGSRGALSLRAVNNSLLLQRVCDGSGKCTLTSISYHDNQIKANE